MKNNNSCIIKLFKFILIYIYLIILIILQQNSNTICCNCKKIELEDYCIGPICEYLLWKPEIDEIDIKKIYNEKKLIYFRNSIIPKIPIELFTVYPDLKQLSISNADVKELPNNIKSDNLEFLYLSNNKIKLIDNDQFKLIPKLKYLWLNYNEIMNLSTYSFDNMENLLFLELSDNEITQLPDEIFRNTPKLTSLFLSRNKITILQNGLFDYNPNLYQLNIDGNNIITMADNIFKNVKILHILDISFNPFRTLNLVNANIENLISNSSNLIKLNIGGTLKQLHFLQTPIKKIELTEPDNLKIINLNECYLRDLSIIEPFNNLLVLNISSNIYLNLDTDAFKNVKYLKSLSVANCNLNQFNFETFGLLKDLEYLDISDNKIEEINLDTLRYMRVLKNITIHGNPWSCCSLKPLIECLKIRKIGFKEEPKLEQASGVYYKGINCIV